MEDHSIKLFENRYFSIEAGSQAFKYSNYHGAIPVILSEISSATGLKRTEKFIKAFKTHLGPIDISEIQMLVFMRQSKISYCHFQFFGSFMQQLAEFLRTFKYASMSLSIVLANNNHIANASSKYSWELSLKKNLYERSQSIEFEKIVSMSRTEKLEHWFEGWLTAVLSIRGLSPKDFLGGDFTTESFSKVTLSNEFADFGSRLLTREFHTDACIVSSTGKKFNCHKLFLIARSPYFETMFVENRFLEGTSNTVVLKNLGDEEVAAILAFIYGDGEEFIRIVENHPVAIRILKASEEFDMDSLKEVMRKQFLSKPDQWYTADWLLDLFSFCSCVENLADLNNRVVNILKIDFRKFRDTDVYKNWSKQNTVDALELVTALMDLN